MNSSTYIDNDEPVFQIDHFEPLKSLHLLEVSSRSPQPLSSAPSCEVDLSSIMSSATRVAQAQEPSSSSVHNPQDLDDLVQDKGKGIPPQAPSEPMSILPGRTVLDAGFDLFSMSLDSAGSSSRVVESIFASDLYTPNGGDFQADTADGEGCAVVEGKGKGRELPPSLPPLSFTPTEFLYGSADWPSVAGPSSYGSTFSSVPDADGTPDMNITAPLSTPSSPEQPGIRTRVPSRARSLSNLSIRSRHSLSGLSMTKVKLKLSGSKISGNLAKKLFRRRDGSPSTPTSPLSEPDLLPAESPLVEVTMAGMDVLGQSGCFVPWARDMMPRTPLATPVVGTEVAWGSIDPIYRCPRPTDPHPLRTKGRSYSSPLPLPPPFDIVPHAPVDIFAQPPVEVPNYFDEILPHELQIHVLAALVHLHEADHEKRVDGAKWTALKAGATRNKWVGRDKGVRELFRLSRVSKLAICASLELVITMFAAGVPLLASPRL